MYVLQAEGPRTGSCVLTVRCPLFLPRLPHAEWRGLGLLQVQMADGCLEPLCTTLPRITLSS